jgi:hypothetical protein
MHDALDVALDTTGTLSARVRAASLGVLDPLDLAGGADVPELRRDTLDLERLIVRL